MNNTARDEGAIVLGWLTRVVLALCVAGFLAYDGISVLAANFTTADRANTLASEAADDVRNLRDINKAYSVTLAKAQADGDTIRPQEFQVGPDGRVTLVLRTEARSLWVTHVGPLRHFLDVHATGEGAPAS